MNEMLIQEFGIKDLEHVAIKTRNPVVFGNRTLEAGEPILYFEHVQIGILSENTNIIAARGGYDNQPRVIWEDRQDVTFAFTNGTLTQHSFELLLDAHFFEKQPNNPVPYAERDVYLDQNASIKLKHIPLEHRPSFFYLYERGNIQNRIYPINIQDNIITFDSQYAYQKIAADYFFNYEKSSLVYSLAKERLTNLYSLEGTFYLKDENDGLLHSGLIEIPKIHIMSNINLQLGEQSNPMVSAFRAIGMPENNGDEEAEVCRITFFNEDIYGI